MNYKLTDEEKLVLQRLKDQEPKDDHYWLAPITTLHLDEKGDPVVTQVPARIVNVEGCETFIDDSIEGLAITRYKSPKNSNDFPIKSIVPSKKVK